MNRCGILLAATLALAAPSASAADDTAVGRVFGLYVRAADGVFIEKRLLPAHLTEGSEVFADIRLAGSTFHGRDRVVAKLQSGLGVESGDLVELALNNGESVPAAGRRTRTLALMRAQVVALRAKHYTLAAIEFSRPASRRLADLGAAAPAARAVR